MITITGVLLAINTSSILNTAVAAITMLVIFFIYRFTNLGTKMKK